MARWLLFSFRRLPNKSLFCLFSCCCLNLVLIVLHSGGTEPTKMLTEPFFSPVLFRLDGKKAGEIHHFLIPSCKRYRVEKHGGKHRDNQNSKPLSFEYLWKLIFQRVLLRPPLFTPYLSSVFILFPSIPFLSFLPFSFSISLHSV